MVSSRIVCGQFIVFFVINMLINISKLLFGKKVVGSKLFLRNKIINKIKYNMLIIDGLVRVLKFCVYRVCSNWVKSFIYYFW